MGKNIYCNNCGKQGHVYNQCRMPITSIGLVIFKKRKDTNKFEYLLIRRKDSLGFVDFIRGNYNIHHKQPLLNLLEEMTNDEKQKITDKRNSFTSIWREMWGNTFQHSKNKHEESMSRKKFEKLRDKGVIMDGQTETLDTLIAKLDTEWIEPEWGFPKGRRNYHERDLMCAFREFEEETGLKREDLNLISNLVPYEEVYLGSNFKTYKHKYFLGLYRGYDDLFHFQKSEVSKMMWMTYEESLQYIRPYSKERRDILGKIDKALNEYSLVI
jgi:8-oxo-dGTP pyrophosphatase MutT (NUDIX family)